MGYFRLVGYFRLIAARLPGYQTPRRPVFAMVLPCFARYLLTVAAATRTATSGGVPRLSRPRRILLNMRSSFGVRFEILVIERGTVFLFLRLVATGYLRPCLLRAARRDFLRRASRSHFFRAAAVRLSRQRLDVTRPPPRFRFERPRLLRRMSPNGFPVGPLPFRFERFLFFLPRRSISSRSASEYLPLVLRTSPNGFPGPGSDPT